MAPFKLSSLLHHNKDSERRSSTSSTHSTRPPSPGPNANQVSTDSTSFLSEGEQRASPADVYKHQVVSQQYSAPQQAYAGLPTTQRQGSASSSGVGYQLSTNPDDGMRINTANVDLLDGSQSPTPTQTYTNMSGLAPPIPVGAVDANGNTRSRSPSIVISPAQQDQAVLIDSTSVVSGTVQSPPPSILNMTAPLQPVASADEVLLKNHPETTAGRKMSNASRTGQPVNAGNTNSSQSMMGMPTSAESTTSHHRVILVPPHSPSTHAAAHTPADLVHKVKEKVKNRRGSRSSRRSVIGGADSHIAGEDDEEGHHRGKRERLKNRLRGLSDASSGKRQSGLIADDRSSRLSDQESDTTEDDSSDDEHHRHRRSGTAYSDDDDESDAEVGTLRSSVSRMSLPVTGFAVASNKRNQEFHALFHQIDEGDYLIEGKSETLVRARTCSNIELNVRIGALIDYGCALQKDILVHGRIYVSEHHLSFHSNILGWITDVSIRGGTRCCRASS